MTLEELEDYFKRRFRSKDSVRAYRLNTGRFIDAVGIENLATVKYKDIMEYIGRCREMNHTPSYISTQISAIKALFEYMVSRGERLDNPAYGIVLKDAFHKPLQFQDLFTPEELKSLLVDRKENMPQVYNRNQAMISILIYQGVTRKELQAIRVSDIDLEQKEVFVAATIKTLSRILKLEFLQLPILDNYLRHERPILQMKSKVQHKELFLSNLGAPYEISGINHQIELLRDRFPARQLTCITIRQSVLVNKFLIGWQLREVQLFSGIKQATSVDRYRPANRKALQDSMKFHPMG